MIGWGGGDVPPLSKPAANASSRVACSEKREAVPVISSRRRTGSFGRDDVQALA